MDIQTEEHEETPGENFGVIRMRRQVINSNSYVGGIFTSRIGMNGKHNFAYGVDGIFRLFGDDYLNVKLAQSYDDQIDSEVSSLDPSFIMINWERRSEKEWVSKRRPILTFHPASYFHLVMNLIILVSRTE